jgi:riboflavin synthase
VFTGIVEGVGRIVEVVSRPGATRVGIAPPFAIRELADGDSVAVDGVCLTVAGRGAGRFYADVIAETLGRTTLGEARVGRRVNVERSLRLGDRLGGHLVQGHVDDTAPILARHRRGGERRLRVGLSGAIRPYVAAKGSIAVQGVSLTVAALGRGHFEVALVPHTLARTTLGELEPGDRVNVETDLLARYLERMVQLDRTERRSRVRTRRAHHG